jgi:hypothetical protein
MNWPRNLIFILLAAFILGGCASSQYITDKDSIKRQQKMKMHRVGVNAGTVCLNMLSMTVAVLLNSAYEPFTSEQTSRKIKLVNLESDTMTVNMVTDILFQDSIYCDVMGIVLPPGASQKVLIASPGAYNIYYRTTVKEEKKLEFYDNRQRVVKLKMLPNDFLK